MNFVEPEEAHPAQPIGESTGVVRGSSGESLAGSDEGSGWVTTKQAANALGVSRRMVQEYVRRGRLEALVEGEGVSKTYYISVGSLSALREQRGGDGRNAAKPVGDAAEYSSEEARPEKPDEYGGQGIAEVLLHTINRLEARVAEAAELRARLELTAQAESTLREAAEREREKANREKARADGLEAELAEARRTAAELQAASATPSSRGNGRGEEPQEPARRRSWLVRYFFGP